MRNEREAILDALRACVTGEFAHWTIEQHRRLQRNVLEYDSTQGIQAVAFVVLSFFSESTPAAIREALEDEAWEADAAEADALACS